jgi:FKBP-type peptidyl-prolyl cis-trans isomerase SlyD
MKIGKNMVVAVRCDILSADGQMLDHGKHPYYYLHGGYDGIFPKVEEELGGRDEGEEVRVRLAPENAFGAPDPRLVRVEPRSKFNKKIAVGMHVRAELNRGGQAVPHDFRVASVTANEVTLDGNHPLAGQTIEMRCKVVAVRPATRDEIAHRHAHGPDDHHHH